MKEELVKDMVSSISELLEAKQLLDNILSHYSMTRQQFTAIDTMKFPADGDTTAPKSNWTSESDILNKKIRDYLNVNVSK